MKDLDAAAMADVQEWFKTYYGPNNTTVVIAGDITPEVARQKVEKYYGEIPPGPPSPSRKYGSQNAPARIADGYRTAFRRRVCIAFGTCRNTDRQKKRSLTWSRRYLGRGKTSRLYKRLVYKDQIATGALLPMTIPMKLAGNLISPSRPSPTWNSAKLRKSRRRRTAKLSKERSHGSRTATGQDPDLWQLRAHR